MSFKEIWRGSHRRDRFLILMTWAVMFSRKKTQMMEEKTLILTMLCLIREDLSYSITKMPKQSMRAKIWKLLFLNNHILTNLPLRFLMTMHLNSKTLKCSNTNKHTIQAVESNRQDHPPHQSITMIFNYSNMVLLMLFSWCWITFKLMNMLLIGYY